MHVYVASDFATIAGRGDWTVHIALGCDPEDNLWVLDMWRQQADTATSVDALLDMVRQWKPLVAVQEKGQLANAIGPFLRKRMDERKIWFATELFAARAEKSVRCQAIRGMVAVRALRVPADAPWYHIFRSETLEFPVSAHDDIPDCLGLCGQILNHMHAGSPLPQKKVPKLLSFEHGKTTLTLTDLFEDQERRWKKSSQRIS
jgi:predicted phage terminase large subunit-like protein